MTSALALARAEFLVLSRDRVAAFNALVVPIVAAIYLIARPGAAADAPGPVAAAAAAVVLALLASATVVFRSATTLVHRREQHVLERWRASGAAPGAIVAGTLAPGILLLAAGSAVLFPAIAIAFDDRPALPLMLVLAVGFAAALGMVAAVLGAAFARTSDAASIVVLPIVGAILGGAMWATLVPLGEVTWRMRVTGGGALAELVRIGWQGPVADGGHLAALSQAGNSLLALGGLVVVLGWAAARTFRWTDRA